MTQHSPAAGASPVMAQWFKAKAEQPDALVFFRMGDFFELFFEDAEAAAAALDIALTARGSHQGRPIPMCGVPVGQAETYLARLIRRGFRVAIAEQLEDPKTRQGKGPLARGVVRLVTPGTLTEEALLESGQANYLLALAQDGGAVGAAWLDISTGAFETAAVPETGLAGLLGRIDPAEILAAEAIPLGTLESRRTRPGIIPSPARAGTLLAETFGVASVEAFGVFSGAEIVAAGMALAYVRETQAGGMPLLARPRPAGEAGQLQMDAATRASLELVRSRDGAEAATLLAAIRRTVTAPGLRLLAGWISAPLTDRAAILARQQGWGALVEAADAAETLRRALRGAPDLARALGRLGLGRGGPRDLAAIRASLEAARASAAALAGGPAANAALLAAVAKDLEPPPGLAETLAAAIAEPAPLRLDEGAAIRPGFDAELDGHRRLRDDARQVIAALQGELAARYGVPNLKIRHHAQLGYVLEAPNAAVEQLRGFPELVLRQGLAAGARFTHPELSVLDQRISEAAEQAGARERMVFAALVARVLAEAPALAACAEALSLLDVLQSAANLAAGGRWCRPEITDDEDFLIAAGRHPVVEAELPAGVAFIPNDADLCPARRLMLLTGPNMAGKSTYLRQNALIVILAQAGLPAPADRVCLGIVDRLFSRVGAADDLARGRSTFMVEMTETAAILNQAGPKSFVIVDEIGRGTGTRDGLAIAQAVLESLHGVQRCRAIFATHFHELVALGSALPRLSLQSMRVKEWKGQVVFLHEVAEGAAARSWGVHVARLAGVPEPVTRRAEALLAAAERVSAPSGSLPLFAAAPPPRPDRMQDRAEHDPAVQDLRTELEMIDLDRLSPRAALETLYEWRAKFLVQRSETD